MKTKSSLAIATSAALAWSAVSTAPTLASEPHEGTVTNCESSGVGSLAYVWNEVYPNAVINNYTGRIDFAADLNCDTIILEDNLMAEDASMNIIGPGASNLTIRHENSNPVFSNTNGVLQVSGLSFAPFAEYQTITGPDGFAPAIAQLGSGQLHVSGSVFEGYAKPQGDSIIGFGLIYAEGSAYVTGVAFNDIEFSSNSKLIYAESKVTVANSTFTGFVGNTFTEGTLVNSYSNDVVLLNNTFDFNTDGDDPNENIWIASAPGNLKMFGNIFVLPLSVGSNPISPSASHVDGGYNIFALPAGEYDSDAFEFIAQTSLVTTLEDVDLGSFADNGGLAKSLTIGGNSVAKDFVNLNAYTEFVLANIDLQIFSNFMNLNVDQRGLLRFVGEAIDAGSFELALEANVESVRKTVYFSALSAKLTADAKRSLNRMLANLPDDADIRKVILSGFVQPTSNSSNDISLAKARANSVRKFLKALGVKAKFVIKPRGKASIKSAKARKVVVDVRYESNVK
ncbi:MAG: hypothetical protein RL038_106 [Actinomycetota bacterium]